MKALEALAARVAGLSLVAIVACWTIVGISNALEGRSALDGGLHAGFAMIAGALIIASIWRDRLA
jgi:hypothetical protein